MSDKDLGFSGIDFGDVSGEEFTLESILAEYKGDAFIAGQKKTPEDVLEAVTNRILREEKRGDIDEKPITVKTPEINMPKNRPEEKSADNDFFADIRVPFGEEPVKKSEVVSLDEEVFSPSVSEPEKPAKSEREEYEDVLKLFNDGDASSENIDYAKTGFEASFAKEIGQIVEEETKKEVAASKFAEKLARKSVKKNVRKSVPDAEYEDDQDDDYFDIEEDESEDEPTLGEAAAKAGRGVKSLTIRSLVAFLLCVFMAIFTYRFDAGKSVPFGIGDSAAPLTGVLLIMQLLVMMLSVDVLIAGVSLLLKGSFGAETLVTLSNLFAVIQAFSSLSGDAPVSSLPFSTIAAVSLMFALRGKRAYEIAVTETLRSAVSAANPYNMIMDVNSVEDRVVLKKTTATVGGFYRNLRKADVSEYSYYIFAPLIFIISLIFTVLIRYISDVEISFLYVLAALTTVSASFSVMLTFSLPFKRAAKKARRAGAALAGWGGAVNAAMADSVLVTDDDIFPVGTLSINGIKIFEGVSQSKAIIYTSSMIIASGSGAARVFTDLLKNQKYPIESVDDFACYQGGGVSGIIKGERVFVGSAAFMNLMGIRVPDSVNSKDAMFTVINDELSAVFQMNYIPANSVQKALVSIARTKVTMLFAVRDFNISSAMVQRKFKVNISNVEELPVEETYRASEEDVEAMPDSCAVLSRGGLAPMADVIVMGWQLKLISTLTTLVSMITSLLGVFLIAFLCLKSGAVVVSSVMTYMLLVHAVVLLLSYLTKRK